MQILSFGIIIEFVNPNLDSFVHSLEEMGYGKKYFTVGKMIVKDSKSNETLLGYDHMDYDKFNMQGKFCRIFPNYNQIVIHENYFHIRGLDNSNLPKLHDEIKLVITKIKDTITDNLQKCTMLCVVNDSDSHKPSSTNNNSIFDSMDMIKVEDNVIINPNMLTGKSTDKINHIIETLPYLPEKYGWDEIKIQHNDMHYHIFSEFHGKSINETLDTFYNIYQYSSEMINKARNINKDYVD